jgi:hypothetical protein
MGLEEFTDISARLAATVEQLSNEFDGIFERSYVEVLVHSSARQLESASVASFVPILTHRFARERLRAQALALGLLTKSATEVVFVSITGGGRARMAASLLERRVDHDALRSARARPHALTGRPPLRSATRCINGGHASTAGNRPHQTECHV